MDPKIHLAAIPGKTVNGVTLAPPIPACLNKQSLMPFGSDSPATAGNLEQRALPPSRAKTLQSAFSSFFKAFRFKSTLRLLVAAGLLFGASCMALQSSVLGPEASREQSSETKLQDQEMSGKVRRLVLVGGGDDTEFLRYLASCGKVVTVMPVATEDDPDGTWKAYAADFTSFKLGNQVQKLDIRKPQEATFSTRNFEILTNTDVIYFTGGDQKLIVDNMGANSWVGKQIFKLYKQGKTIGGISAGASAFGERMLISETGAEWPGLGYLKGVFVDQHFTQRNRKDRLLPALKQNPGYLGIGIDKRTAIIVENETLLTVKGKGGVHIALDGSKISYVLHEGDMFNLKSRQPVILGKQ